MERRPNDKKAARRAAWRRRLQLETFEQSNARRARRREQYRRRLNVETAEKTAARRAAKREYERLRRSQNRRAAQFEAALADVADISDTVTTHNCGSLRLECKHCGAKFFDSERLVNSSQSNPKFSLCCGDGKVKLWTIPDPPGTIGRSAD